MGILHVGVFPVTDQTDLMIFEKAREARKLIIEMVYSANSGHPGGSLSIIDILTVLYFREMNIDPTNPNDPQRDRLVMSKGHASPSSISPSPIIA